MDIGKLTARLGIDLTELAAAEGQMSAFMKRLISDLAKVNAQIVADDAKTANRRIVIAENLTATKGKLEAQVAAQARIAQQGLQIAEARANIVRQAQAADLAAKRALIETQTIAKEKLIRTKAEADMAKMRASRVAAEEAMQAKLTAGAVAGANARLMAEGRSLKQFMAQWATFAQRIRTIGYLASATLTLPIVAAGKAVFNLARDFEYSMQKIVGLIGIPQDVTNQWAEDIKKLSIEIGKSPKELAEGMYFVASSGMRGAQALDVLKMSAKASAAGLGETKDVANVLTSALNAYQGTGLTAASAADILTAAVRVGKAEADTFATSMGQIIPIAANLGVSFDQVAGGMAAITLTGSSTAQAATYLKGVFNTLNKAAEQGEKVLGATNISYEELRRILAEDGLIALLQKLRDIQLKYGQEALGDVIPNIRGLTGYLSIAGKNFQYNSQIMQEVTESAGSLEKAYQAIAGTIKQRTNKAISAMQVSFISLGQTVANAVLPVIENLAIWVTRTTSHFDSLTDSQKRFRLALVAGFAALGPVLLLGSTLLYLLRSLTTVVLGLAKGIGKLVIAMRGASTAMSATAIGAVVLAIAGLTAGVVRLIKHLNNLKRIEKEITTEQIKESWAIDGLFKAAQNLSTSSEERIKTLEKINSLYGEYLPQLLTEASSLDEIADAYDTVRKSMVAKIALEHYSDELSKQSDKTAKIFRRNFGEIMDLIEQVKPAGMGLADFYTEMFDYANKAIDEGTGKVDENFRNAYASILYRKYITPEVQAANRFSAPFIDLTKERFEAMFTFFTRQIEHEFPLTKRVKEMTLALTELSKKTKDVEDDLNKIKAPVIPGFETPTGKVPNQKLQLLWDNLHKEKTELELVAEAHKKYNTEVSKTQDFVTLYTRAVEDLTILLGDKNAGAVKYFAERLNEATKQLEAEKEAAKGAKEVNKDLAKVMDDLAMAVGDLNTSLAVNKMKSFMLGPSFDLDEANLKAYEKAIEDLYEASIERVRIDIQKYIASHPLDMFGNIAVTSAILAQRLESAKKQFQEWQKEIDAIMSRMAEKEDMKTIRFLNAQAEAFGGLENQAKILEQRLSITERQLRKIGEDEGFTENFRIKADEVNNLRQALKNLQDEMDLDVAVQFADSFKDAGHYIDVLETKINILTNQMKDMVLAGTATPEMLAKSVKEIEQLNLQAEGVRLLNDSLSDFFMLATKGYESLGKAVEAWAMSLLRSINQLLANMVAKKILGIILGFFTAGPAGAAAGGFIGDMVPSTPSVGGGAITSANPVNSIPGFADMISAKQFNQPMTHALSGEVHFEIQGDSLVGILQKQTKKNSIY